MRVELKRINAMSLAKVMAVIQCAIMTVCAVVFAPIMLLGLMFGGENRAAGVFGFLMMLAYPILGLVLGWIFGWLSGVVYNFAAGRLGGVKLELAEDAVAVTAAAPVAPLSPA